MITIRMAAPSDAEELLRIYRYYVENTAITFEYEVPSVAEFQARIENTLQKYPYLVALEDEQIVGYAYAGAFGERAAYDWSAELSIYLAPKATKRGYGRALYQALETALKDMGILNLYACIAYTTKPDAYLTNNSAEFHQHLGFERVGKFQNCGYKFGRWYSMIWMEKIIGEHVNEPKPVNHYL